MRSIRIVHPVHRNVMNPIELYYTAMFGVSAGVSVYRRPPGDTWDNRSRLLRSG